MKRTFMLWAGLAALSGGVALARNKKKRDQKGELKPNEKIENTLESLGSEGGR